MEKPSEQKREELDVMSTRITEELDSNQSPDAIKCPKCHSPLSDPVYIEGGNFPCGLMELQFFAYAGTSVTLQIDLVPGTHRGYLAEPMTDM